MWGDDDADSGLTIDPFKMTALQYDRERHFGWPYHRRPQARLYLQFRTVGRSRSSAVLIYRPQGGLRGMLSRAQNNFGIGRYIDEKSEDILEGFDG